jgi:hypothetical protein
MDERRAPGRTTLAGYHDVPAADPALRQRILDRVLAAAPPRPVMSPSPGLLALAATLLVVAGVGLGWWLRGAREDRLVSGTNGVRVVEFALVAPHASRVSVVGDFNGWDPTATPMRRTRGRLWQAAVPVPVGRHVYAFVVDGDQWMPDPAAPISPEDEFGTRNSVLIVGGT